MGLWGPSCKGRRTCLPAKNCTWIRWKRRCPSSLSTVRSEDASLPCRSIWNGRTRFEEWCRSHHRVAPANERHLRKWCIEVTAESHVQPAHRCSLPKQPSLGGDKKRQPREPNSHLEPKVINKFIKFVKCSLFAKKGRTPNSGLLLLFFKSLWGRICNDATSCTRLAAGMGAW